jgi:hypothetical protein|tara:strand:- start:174 stop:719 length:546 start_codon:yes stop_codon:yes gene_type:complete
MTTLLTKVSTTALAVPSASDLTQTASGAELAVNTTDKKLYSKDSTNTVIEIASVLQAYPVGSIYVSTVSTDPGTLFGGTWEAFADGKVLVGHSSSDTDFDASSGTTGGNKTTNLTVGQLPAHTHDVQYDNEPNMEKQSGGGHVISELDGTTLTRTTTSTGNGDALELLQPYISVYMFKRTA